MRAPAFWWNEPGAAAALLSPLAAIYGSIAARRLAQSGTHVGVPVICVGNPTVGGAGKTPTAIAIARLLMAAGEQPMFLTRGYGGRLAGPVMVEAGHSAIQVGDEPLLLTRIAPTIVAHNRVAGAKLAGTKGASVIVMDDGFQNPSLAKDFSILVIDGTRRFGNGRVIPAGPLRAPLAPQFARADAILVVGGGDGPRLEHFPLIPAQAGIQRNRARALGPRFRGDEVNENDSVEPENSLDIPASVPVFHGVLEPDARAVISLAGKKVLAFAGIGDPEKFFATLAAVGIDAPDRRAFPDHHRYTGAQAAALIADADRGGLTLLTTEKDLARMTGDIDAVALAQSARALPVTLRIREAEQFEAILAARAFSGESLSRT